MIGPPPTLSHIVALILLATSPGMALRWPLCKNEDIGLSEPGRCVSGKLMGEQYPLAHGQLGRPTNWAGPPVQAGMVLVAETWSSNSEDEAARTPANPNEALHQHESPHPAHF